MLSAKQALRTAVAALAASLLLLTLVPAIGSAAPLITEYGGLPAASRPRGITLGSDGAIWFTESAADSIGRIDPASGAVASYGGLAPGCLPSGITTGPDGALWFTESAAAGNAIIRMDPVWHSTTLYGGLLAGCNPQEIVTGPDGALWFTEQWGQRIGRLDPGSGVVTEYPVTGQPLDITMGPDGAMWFTEPNLDLIGRIDPSTFIVNEYAGPSPGSIPYHVVHGPNGELWFTENGTDKIGRMNPVTHAVTEYAGMTGGAGPQGITMGPDEALWFTEYNGNRIGRMDPDTHAISEYAIPSAASGPDAIVLGPDDNLWFTEYNGNRIGRVALSYSVNARAVGAGGHVSPATQSVYNGGSATVTFSADPGYRVASVTDNGESKPATSPYRLTNVSKSHDVVVTFMRDNSTWYLAEGSTAWGFNTYISIENANPGATGVTVTYMPTGAANRTENLTLPPNSQTTLTNDHLTSIMGGPADFSTEVKCADPARQIAVDRTMTWTGRGAAAPESHCSVGVVAPAKAWYLPEGSSAWGFETWLLIQNPGATAAAVKTTYMIEGDSPLTIDHEVPAHSRATFNIAQDIGAEDASIKVESNVPVIPERAMYKNDRREGHDSIGTTAPAGDYYLAEGTTAWGFTTYILIQNPNSAEADVTITYMTPEGPRPQPDVRMPANSRKTIRVNDVAGMGQTDFSTAVHGSRNIIAERAMYWQSATGEACHDSIGVASPHGSFFLPDGEAGGAVETWTLVQNPNSTPVEVDVTYLTPSGTGNVTRRETIGARSRRTFGMREHSNLTGRASIQVVSRTAGKKVMVERAMYWNSRGAGTDTIGGNLD